MSKMLTILAAVAVTAMAALPATAAEQRGDGVRNPARVETTTKRVRHQTAAREIQAPVGAYNAYGYAPYAAESIPNSNVSSHAAFGFGG